jgi:hypothetical protein
MTKIKMNECETIDAYVSRDPSFSHSPESSPMRAKCGLARRLTSSVNETKAFRKKKTPSASPEPVEALFHRRVTRQIKPATSDMNILCLSSRTYVFNFFF